MYLTIAELALINQRLRLLEAQIMLASARRGSNTEHVTLCEEHVVRMLEHAWNAETRVVAERKRRNRNRIPKIEWAR